MARENYILLYGCVISKPHIEVSDNGQYLKGRIILQTARRTFATEDLQLRGDIRWDTPCIQTKRPELIRKIFTKIRQGDMVMVKGNLCSYEVTRKAVCPRCGNIVRKEGGVITYVDPICVYIEQRGEQSFQEYREERKLSDNEAIALKNFGLIGITLEQAAELLERKVEISNQVYVDGELCREPQFYEDTEKHFSQIQFQIAVNRKRYIKEDNPEKKTDYIWIKAYGGQAKEYADTLHLHSKITVNGAIQTRKVMGDYWCENCGLLFQKGQLSQEIVPYSIEYRDNCTLPDPEEREDNNEEKTEFS